MHRIRPSRARVGLCPAVRAVHPSPLARLHSTVTKPVTSSPRYRTSTLPNGIQVRTDPTGSTMSEVCALALVVRAGPRFEHEQTEGCSYTVERSTVVAMHEIGDTMDPELTPLACKVVPNLEYQTLHLSHLRSPRHLSAALDFLSRMLRARTTFFSYMPTDDVPGQEYMMDDLLHAVAYGGRGLGRRSVPTRQRLREVLNGEFRSFGLVESWRREWWIQHGDRMTVAGSGMKHEDLERETKKALGWVGGEDLTFEPPRTVKEGIAPWIVKIKAWLYPPTPPVIFEPAGFKAMSKAPSVYDGGMVVLEDGGGAGFLEGGTEIRIAFEGLPEEDDDVLVLEVISTILGGRRSWENGSGPGSGLRSRLWLNVLNANSDVSSAKAFNLSYSDTGLFGISAQILNPSPDAIAALFKLLANQLHQITLPAHTYGRVKGKPPAGAGTGRLTVQEIERAKNRTATEWLTERENRAGDAYLDDLAFCRPTPAEIAAKIASIKPADIQRVARRILGSSQMPTVVGMGPGSKEGLKDAMRLLGKAVSSWS